MLIAWKTLGLNAALAVASVLQATDVVQLVPPAYAPYAGAIAFAVNAFLPKLISFAK